MTYIDQDTRMSLWHLPGYGSILHLPSPYSGIFLRIDPLSSVPTQHLIAPIPQPSRDDRWVSSLGFDPIVDDTTDVGLVVEDILDGHS